MKKKSASVPGHNRTGLMHSPIEANKSMDNTKIETNGNEQAFAKVRSEYVEAGGALGTMPAKAVVKLAKGFKSVTDTQMALLIDKIGERMAFERQGTRLYDAACAKVSGMNGSGKSSVRADDLMEVRNDEKNHFEMLAKCLVHLKADPTVVTPGADASSVASSGILQLVSDPRSTLSQALSGLLIAELADHDSWEMLIELANKFGLKDEAKQFEKALKEEDEHLTKVRAWLKKQIEIESS